MQDKHDFPGGASGKAASGETKRSWFDPWVEDPWRRKWQTLHLEEAT